MPDINVLARVNEAVSGSTGDAGFKNGASSDTEFAYNAWGNLTKDDNKDIDSVKYNFLGKPRKVYFGTGKVVEYSYDASGSKLSVKTLQGGTTEAFSNYVGGFVYEGATPALSFFSSPGGRVVKNGTAYEYQYSLADNQGNTRIIFTSVTPESYVPIATLEGDAGDNAGDFSNVSNVVTFTAANHTAGGSKVVRMNQGYAAGPSKSIKVYPGDKVDAEVWTYYESASGYGTGSPGVAAMVTAIATGFGGASGGGGESGSIYDGVNSALGGFGLGGNAGDNAPAAYLNYILFDQQYKVLNMGWIRVPTSASYSKQKINLSQVSVTEAGYIFVYLSYEDQSNNYVYFDDFKITHTKSNLIQGNEYYPFGMQTANSWSRESVTGNRYLANGGTEMNSTTQLYDLEFRNYDPALGRMYGVDPVAAKYASLTPYNYSFNNPVGFSDPSGADPEVLTNTPPANAYYFHNGAGAAGYPGLTYDDWIPQNTRGEYNNAFGWRTDFTLGWFNGSGPSLNAGSFGYQSTRYQVGAVLKGIGQALASDDGGEVNVVNGSFTQFDQKGSMAVAAIHAAAYGLMTEGLVKEFKKYFTPYYAGPGVDDYFEGVRIIDSNVLELKNGAAATLPGIGIFLSKTYWEAQPNKDLRDLLKHEYGHIIQAEKWGKGFFYEFVAPLSVHSAMVGDGAHKYYWTERTANYFATQHFGSENWNNDDYPIYKPQRHFPNRNFNVPPFGLPGLPVWWDKSDTINRG